MNWYDLFPVCIVALIVSLIWIFGHGIYQTTVEVSPAEYEFVQIMQEKQPDLQEKVTVFMKNGKITIQDFDLILKEYNKKNNSDNLKVLDK